MGIFQRLFPGQSHAPDQPASGIVPAAPRIKSLAELEQELELKSRAAIEQNRSAEQRTAKKTPRLINKLLWMAILLGVPITALWVVNLPYAPIRRPMARTAPILLLPSYISMDNNYRQAIASLEQATQLIDQATSPTDLDLGAQKLHQAQVYLDALPIGLLDYWADYRSWWYDWRLSPSAFNASRAAAGRLQAKVFQERNAQNALLKASQAVSTAKQQYQQAKNTIDQQVAIADWRAALDQFQQIPGQTLAGKTAQHQREVEQRDFQQIVGLAAGNQKVAMLIEAAQQFSWQAAKAGQNPPHSVEEWQQIEALWQEAIARLKQIPADDLMGYAEAQRLLAKYQADLGQTRVRQRAEAVSAQSLQSAKRLTATLLANSPTQQADRRATISQLQQIINELQMVQSGTTAYLEAQQLLLSAQNKLKQLQS